MGTLPEGPSGRGLTVAQETGNGVLDYLSKKTRFRVLFALFLLAQGASAMAQPVGEGTICSVSEAPPTDEENPAEDSPSVSEEDESFEMPKNDGPGCPYDDRDLGLIA